jgi:GNAT superfamily N-acetyltransferase
MRIEVTEEPITAIDEYAGIPIAFKVDSVLDVKESDRSFHEFLLTERRLPVAYVKDYDAIDGEQPNRWASRFDVSNWGVLAARVEGQRVGGAVIALNTPTMTTLEGRNEVAVLWDMRVSPDARRQGVGSALFRAAEEWGKARGCRQIKVETQNINVAACRFYASQGCTLTSVNRHAYPELPGEIQLLWHKGLE